MEKNNKNNNVPKEVKLEYIPTEKQMELHTCAEPFILYGGAIGGGKLLSLDAQILTPHGFKCMRDIEAGDFVFDMDGNPVAVLTCTEHTYSRKCYELEFDGGEKVIADAEHLWVAYSRADREKLYKRTDEYRAKRRASRPSRSKGKRPDVIKKNQEKIQECLSVPDISTITTEELFKNKFIYRPKNPPMVNYSIPVAKPVQFSKKEYKVSPYALGAFLGDGSRNSNYMTCDYCDDQVIQEMAKDEKLPWRRMENQRQKYSVDGIRSRLREIGVLNNKHVPTEYLFGSYEQRLSLVQGLMDTDGTVLENGKAEFTSSLENLSESLAFVLRSLGIKCNVIRNKAKLYGRECKDRYRVSFHTTLPVCRLKRKLDRIPKTVRDTCKYHYIVDIKEVESVPVKCIAVDSPTKTYLATKSLIPTHNSVAGVNDMLQRAIEYNNNTVGIYRWENQAFEKSTMQTVERWILNPPASHLIANHNKSKKVITLVNGSQIFYGGLKPSSNADLCSIIRSFERTAMFVDEVTDMPEHVFSFLCGRVGRMKAIDPRTGQEVVPPKRIICTCNPHPGWVKKRFVDQQLPKHKFIKSTSKDNPHIGADYVEDQKIFQTKEYMETMIEGNWDTSATIDYLYPTLLVSRAVNSTIIPAPDCNIFMGVDPAFYGDDTAVIVLAKGDDRGVKAEIIYEGKKQDIEELANIVEELYKEHEPLEIRVDVVGNQVSTLLINRGLPIQTISGGALNDGFVNRRAELYWNLYELLEKGIIQIPDCQELIDEMCEIKFMRNTAENKFMVESKKDFKKRRGGKSPDRLDALVYACGEIADSYIIGGLI